MYPCFSDTKCGRMCGVQPSECAEGALFLITCQDLILTPVIVPKNLQLDTVIRSTCATSDPPRLPTLRN
jgi:hypothetical protein